MIVDLCDCVCVQEILTNLQEELIVDLYDCVCVQERLTNLQEELIVDLYDCVCVQERLTNLQELIVDLYDCVCVQERLTNLQEELSKGRNEVGRQRDMLASLEEQLKVCKNNAKTQVSDLEYNLAQTEVGHHTEPGLYAGYNYCQSHMFWWTHLLDT